MRQEQYCYCFLHCLLTLTGIGAHTHTIRIDVEGSDYLPLLYGRTPPTPELSPRSGEELAAEARTLFGDRGCVEGLHEVSVEFRYAAETSEAVR